MSEGEEKKTRGKDRLGVVIPVYNEEGALPVVLDSWLAALTACGCEFVMHLYDDGSRDASAAILADYATKDSRVVVHHKANTGHGMTVLQGYRENIGCFSWLLQIDSDDEMGPEEFKTLWTMRQNFDFLIGIRTGRRQTLSRKLVSWGAQLVVRTCFNGGIHDVNCPYRLLRCEAFAPLIARMPVGTYSPNLIISGWAMTARLRCYQLPVQHWGRSTGVVTLRNWKLLKTTLLSIIQLAVFAVRHRTLVNER